MPPKSKPSDNSADETIAIDESGRPAHARWWKVHRLHRHWHHFSRKEKLLAAAFVGALIGTLVFILMLTTGLVQAPAGLFHKAEKKNVIVSPLTGLPTTKKLAERPVTGIMIENSPDARPQSGLADAGVVFEAIAEGGITRFLALFQEATPQYIGPVRSLRPYYIDWAKGFDASIAHVGGSPQALSEIRSHGKDLDQFFNGDYYTRIAARPAPHNVYTSFDRLDALNKSKGYTKSHFDGWARKDEQPAKHIRAGRIDLSISGPLYNVTYKYNPKSNNYRRFEGGQPHLATKSAASPGNILHPKVVIAMVMSYGVANDGLHSDYQTIGHGRAYVFEDGKVIKGSWSKPTQSDQLKFSRPAGGVIRLDAGQTWVTAVNAASDVSWHK